MPSIRAYANIFSNINLLFKDRQFMQNCSKESTSTVTQEDKKSDKTRRSVNEINSNVTVTIANETATPAHKHHHGIKNTTAHVKTSTETSTTPLLVVTVNSTIGNVTDGI